MTNSTKPPPMPTKFGGGAGKNRGKSLWVKNRQSCGQKKKQWSLQSGLDQQKNGGFQKIREKIFARTKSRKRVVEGNHSRQQKDTKSGTRLGKGPRNQSGDKRQKKTGKKSIVRHCLREKGKIFFKKWYRGITKRTTVNLGGEP